MPHRCGGVRRMPGGHRSVFELAVRRRRERRGHIERVGKAMTKSLSISPAEDDDDWMDITPQRAAAVIKADATVRLSANEACTKNSASIALRNELASWAEKHGPTFRIQIGGSNANKLRVLPDKRGGYKGAILRGTYRLRVRDIAAWPFESRVMPVEAAVTFADADKALILTLPEDFAKPIGSRPKPPLKAAPAKPTTPSPSTAPEFRRVVGLGEPAPGRSALDQRRAEAARGK